MQFLKNDCYGSGMLTMALKSIVICVLLFGFSACQKNKQFEDIRYIDVNYRIFKGSLFAKDLMSESKSWMQLPNKGTLVFQDIYGQEKRFELGVRVRGYSKFDIAGNFRPASLLPPFGFDAEVIYQRAVGEDDTFIEFQLGVIPTLNASYKTIEWKEGKVCMDYFHVSIDSVNYQSLDDQPSLFCGNIFTVSTRGFDVQSEFLSGSTRFQSQVELPEGLILEDVYENVRRCGASEAIYVKKEIGIAAFRDRNNKLWVFDRIE